ncbi:MAG: hypothetical protein NC253_02965 [Ruminococcus sp.]|nr:hypothetical protein [Ruminococcus sp.]MCM1380356.1 hypothetical protein [Muribaculaceae bacterium]MCM1478334.1 hypothetical protein [Muribaculaceae bacterium]
MPKEKFIEYSLNPNKSPNKAKAFKEALGYTSENYTELIDKINDNIDKSVMKLKGNNGHGDLYEQVMNITGANNKNANVCTGWIAKPDDNNLRLTSVYVTKKEVTK